MFVFAWCCCPSQLIVLLRRPLRRVAKHSEVIGAGRIRFKYWTLVHLLRRLQRKALALFPDRFANRCRKPGWPGGVIGALSYRIAN